MGLSTISVSEAAELLAFLETLDVMEDCEVAEDIERLEDCLEGMVAFLKSFVDACVVCFVLRLI